MPETRQPHIEHALDLLDRETTYATDERAAFAQFRRRIDDLEPTSIAPTGTPGEHGGDAMARIATASRPDTSAQSVRTAYRETVVAVPHFEAEYGETVRTNFAAELGAEIAAQIFDAGRLTPPVYDALRTAAEQAIEERTTYLDTLATERESLGDTRDRLDDCESRAAELGRAITPTLASERRGEIDDALAALEATCADLAESRQRLLHDRSTARLVGISGESLVRFLYADCRATCPALADIADCIETIRTHRARCLE